MYVMLHELLAYSPALWQILKIYAVSLSFLNAHVRATIKIYCISFLQQNNENNNLRSNMFWKIGSFTQFLPKGWTSFPNKPQRFKVWSME